MLHSIEKIKNNIVHCRLFNPFEKCPVYETDKLLFTEVKQEDAEE